MGELYPKFLERRRGDFTISEFTTTETRSWGKNLKRVPGVKVSLVSPRVLPISPARSDIQDALDTFIVASRNQTGDLIADAFRRSGFFGENYGNWVRLFPTD